MQQQHSSRACARNIAHFFYCALAALVLAAASSSAFADKVNLNTADAEALQYIPGIGPGKSAEIIRVREEIGGFKTIDDLLTVPGIGPKILVDVMRFGVLEGGVSTLTEEMAANPPRATIVETVE